jgi:glyoxylase-like metal-dependent hydrolase (beta-lactamase superfamily II)
MEATKHNTPMPDIYLVKESGNVRLHSFVSPGSMFANATHIIELPTQLILVDGQFFAQYGEQFRVLADSLNKPITRMYVTHDHPDHYIGMGDAFADVKVYALSEIKDSIAKIGQHELEEKQHQLGSLVPSKIAYPTEIVKPGSEVIDGTHFIFEKVTNTESPVTLVIKLPDLGIAIVQDILYHNTHAFISGPVEGWIAALQNLQRERYDILLPGHGAPADKAAVDNAIAYLEKAYALFSTAASESEYKQQLLQAFPNYAGTKLIDIYLPMLFKSRKAIAL